MPRSWATAASGLQRDGREEEKERRRGANPLAFRGLSSASSATPDFPIHALTGRASEDDFQPALRPDARFRCIAAVVAAGDAFYIAEYRRAEMRSMFFTRLGEKSRERDE